MKAPTKFIVTICHISGINKQYSFDLDKKEQIIKIFEDLVSERINSASIAQHNHRLMLSSSFIKNSIITI